MNVPQNLCKLQSLLNLIKPSFVGVVYGCDIYLLEGCLKALIWRTNFFLLRISSPHNSS